MSKFYWLAMCLAFTSVAYGQAEIKAPESLDVKVTAAAENVYTQTLTTSQIEVEGVAIGEQRTAVSEPVASVGKSVAVLKVSGFDMASSTIKVKCVDSDCDYFEVERGLYAFTTPGTHKAFVFVQNDKSRFNDFTFVDVTVGNSPNPPPGPTPVPPGPDPGPVPDDNYGNIGQRVAAWATGLPKRSEVSQAYKNAANELLHTPIATANSVTTQLGSDRAAALGADVELWKPLFAKTQDDLNSRWPMSKGSYAEYLLAISRGLDGAK